MLKIIVKSSRPSLALRICKRCYCQHRERRFNQINIQMLSDTLHRQIFRRTTDQKTKDKPHQGVDQQTLDKIWKHLSQHQLADKQTSVQQDVTFQLPELYGSNIDQHFRYIAEQQIAGYKQLIDRLIHSTLPPKPSTWNYQSGWTQYQGNKATSVEFPG